MKKTILTFLLILLTNHNVMAMEPKVSGNCQKCNKLLDNKKAIIVTLPCTSKHQFHFKCIQSDMEAESPVCPKCKQGVKQEDIIIHVAEGIKTFKPSTDDCTICIEQLNPFKQKIAVLNCSAHDKFHFTCISEALKTKTMVSSTSLIQVRKQMLARRKYPRISGQSDYQYMAYIANQMSQITEQQYEEEQKKWEEAEIDQEERDKQLFDASYEWQRTTTKQLCPNCNFLGPTIAYEIGSEKKTPEEINQELFNACKTGQVLAVRDIIKQNPKYINHKFTGIQESGGFFNGSTPLFVASAVSPAQEEVVHFLLEPTEEDGKTELKLAEKATINFVNQYNMTPLFQVARSGNVVIFDLLLKHMTPSERKEALTLRSTSSNTFDYTVYHRAILAGQPNFVKKLIPYYESKDPDLQQILNERIQGRMPAELAWVSDEFSSVPRKIETIIVLLEHGITTFKKPMNQEALKTVAGMVGLTPQEKEMVKKFAQLVIEKTMDADQKKAFVQDAMKSDKLVPLLDNATKIFDEIKIPLETINNKQKTLLHQAVDNKCLNLLRKLLAIKLNLDNAKFAQVLNAKDSHHFTALDLAWRRWLVSYYPEVMEPMMDALIDAGANVMSEALCSAGMGSHRDPFTYAIGEKKEKIALILLNNEKIKKRVTESDDDLKEAKANGLNSVVAKINSLSAASTPPHDLIPALTKLKESLKTLAGALEDQVS